MSQQTETASAPSDVAPAPPAAPIPLATWLVGAVILIFGLLVCRQLSLEWTVNPTYAYGWAVPFLSAYLFYERWQRRPAAPAHRPSLAWLAVPLLLVLSFAPVRLVQEANPDWVKANWTLTAQLLGVCASAIFMLGGWRYLWHFAFPLVFFATALPWPVIVEEQLILNLMGANAFLTAESLTIAGYPAFSDGSLVSINGTWVNVEEACSGIRSLQTAFMVSLFLGEFYRMGIFRRLFLMASSFGVAFVINLARTIALTVIAGNHGGDVMDEWHDSIGTATMFGCLAALWLLSEIIRSRKPEPSVTPPAAPRWAPFPLGFSVAAGVLLLSAEAGTQAWYRYHEDRTTIPPAWSFHWPEDQPGFERTEPSERTAAILKYNEGEQVAWRTNGGDQWYVYNLRWLPGRVSKFLSMSHHPSVCLPSAGMKLVSELGQVPVTIGDQTHTFNAYLFERGTREMFMFHAIIEDIPTSSAPLGYRQVPQQERIASALRGERNLGQRVLGISVVGPISFDEARVSLTELLNRVVVVEGSPSLPQP